MLCIRAIICNCGASTVGNCSYVQTRRQIDTLIIINHFYPAILLPSYRSGYVPGEMIPFSAKISNNSTTKIKNTTVRLMRAVRFRENRSTIQLTVHRLISIGGISCKREDSEDTFGPWGYLRKEEDLWISAEWSHSCWWKARMEQLHDSGSSLRIENVSEILWFQFTDSTSGNFTISVLLHYWHTYLHRSTITLSSI